MMKLRVFIGLFAVLLLFSCKKDDKPFIEPPRDEAEVYQENQAEILEFLQTHTFHTVSYPNNPYARKVVFDSIGPNDTDKVPMIDDSRLKTKTVKPGDFEYTLYYLSIQEGAEDEYQPTFADKIVLSYQAKTFEDEVFEETVNPRVIDLPLDINEIIVTKGTVAGITEFRGSSGIFENPDGTIIFEGDYGFGIVFVPSGLGYFQFPPALSSLRPYKPFIFTFQLLKGIQMDHDGDGIPSFMEDLNGNGILLDDDTDGDGVANFLDNDDDGDGIPTRDEIIIHQPADRDWLTPEDIEFPDTDGSGTPNYLDPRK